MLKKRLENTLLRVKRASISYWSTTVSIVEVSHLLLSFQPPSMENVGLLYNSSVCSGQDYYTQLREKTKVWSEAGVVSRKIWLHMNNHQKRFPEFNFRLIILPVEGRRTQCWSVEGLNPVCYLSQHGSHTYIEAYLFSMIIIACLLYWNINLYWMLQGLLCCYFFPCLLQTEDNGLSVLSQNMVWIGHISVSLRFKKRIKKFYKYDLVSSGYCLLRVFLSEANLACCVAYACLKIIFIFITNMFFCSLVFPLAFLIHDLFHHFPTDVTRNGQKDHVFIASNN